MKRPIASAVMLISAVSTASAEEVLIAEITTEFSYGEIKRDIAEARIFASIWEEPTGAQSNIFNEIFLIETVNESDVGTIYSADLHDPTQAAQLARLTNGVADNIWTGSDSANGSRYESATESAIFTGQPGPAGLQISGPDLEHYTPTRVELELADLVIDNGFFFSTISGATVFRIYAEAELSVTVDISGANYWGLEGDPDNDSRVFDLAALLGLPPNTAMEIRATTAEFQLTSVAPSPGWHALTTFDYNNDGSWSLSSFSASETFSFPVTEEQVVIGPIFVEDVFGFLPFSPLGIVRVGFEDHVEDDIPNAPDAFIEPGGTASFIVIPACNQADRQIPLGVLDLNDISRFVGSFLNQLPGGDLAPPFGTFDLNDITVFVNAFNAGCPE